jgi:aminopeptidase N
MFDPITYDKGESVLRMLETFVGGETFQSGIHDYLDAHKFGNAKSEDLWQSVGARTKGLAVPEIMKTWVFEAGFPIVSVSTKDGGKSILASQERFLSMPAESPLPTLWLVPLVLRELKPDSTSLSRVLEGRQQEIDLPDAWKTVIANAGGNGFYRVRYSQDDLKNVLSNFSILTPEERLAVIADISAEVWQGSLPVEERLLLILNATGEKDVVVETKLVDACLLPYSYMDSDTKKEYAVLLQKVLNPIKDHIGWTPKPSEAPTMKDLREVVLTVLGGIGHDTKTITEARDLFSRFMKDHQSVPADVVRSVLAIVAYNGDAGDYEQVLAAWKSEHVPELEKSFLLTLGKFRQPQLVERTLNLVLSADVRAQDGFLVLAELLRQDDTKQRAWGFVKSHWSEVTAKFPPRSLSQMSLALSSFNKPDEETDLKNFFAQHPLPTGKASVARMLEEVNQAVSYRKRNEGKIKSWVASQTGAH